jgi:hypothetical protein
MKIEKDYPHLGRVFLNLLSSNKDFKVRFEAFAPEVYSEVQSYVTNPNCTCKAKISEYVKNNKEKCADFVNLFLLEFDVDVDLDKINSEVNAEIGMGRIIRIKKSEWVNFNKNMIDQGIRYRGFSVVPVDDEHIDVYIL